MSDKNFIIVSVATCLALLFCYDIVIRYFLVGKTIAAENQWSQNIVRAEEFIYNPSKQNIILVGSSLTERLKPEFFNRDTSNLAFVAKSVFEGLTILDRGGYSPDLVLVETNLFFNLPDPEFVDNLYSIPAYQLKKHVYSLREKYKPINDLSTWIYLFLSGSSVIAPPDQVNVSQQKVSSTNEEDTKLYKYLVELELSNRADTPVPSTKKDEMRLLKVLVNELRKRGTNVVFFELPTDPKICSDRLSIASRTTLAKIFPTTQYNFLPMPVCDNYKTTDGMHLPPDEAVRFVKKLSEQLVDQGFVE